MSNTLEVTEVESGRSLGRIWQDGPDKVHTDPPGLVMITKRFFEAGASAPEAIAAMEGWTNGYLVIRAVQ